MPRILVLHRGYGCDTGCCGHYIEVDGREVAFLFEHPGGSEERMDFIRRIVAQKLGDVDVADIDFTDCVVLDD